MTPWELQEEKIVANLFKRPMRHYIHDKPTYPYVPTNVPYCVNFDLNAPQ